IADADDDAADDAVAEEIERIQGLARAEHARIQAETARAAGLARAEAARTGAHGKSPTSPLDEEDPVPEEDAEPADDDTTDIGDADAPEGKPTAAPGPGRAPPHAPIRGRGR